MSAPLSVLNLEAVKQAQLHLEPFPYMIVDNILTPHYLSQVMETFPQIKKRGSFPLSAITCKGAFGKLINELQHPALKALIGERFDMDLEDRPAMMTVRGYTTERDGHIHVDSESKLITVLLYLNHGWQNPDGRLRLLYNNHDLNNFVAEVPPEAGRCLIFKVTPNCWHGHAPFVGERKSIQLNYVTSDSAAERHMKRHKISAFLKKLLRKDDSARSTY